MERGIDERVVAGGAHGQQVAAHLDEVDVTLPQDGEVWVQVTDEIDHLQGEPGTGKAQHRHQQQDKGLPPSLPPCRLAATVTGDQVRGRPLPQVM